MKQSPKEPVESTEKKPYSKPHLQVYGDLREITDTLAHNSPHNDGAGYPNNRTH